MTQDQFDIIVAILSPLDKRVVIAMQQVFVDGLSVYHLSSSVDIKELAEWKTIFNEEHGAIIEAFYPRGTNDYC